MKDTEDNHHPAAFANASLDEATERLLAIMRETRPQVLITYDKDGGYGHPDHVMTHRVSVEAFKRAQGEPWGPRKLYFSARSREGFRRYADGLARLGMTIPWIDSDFDFDAYGLPEAEITAHIDISRWARLKKQALAVHRTQIPPDFFYLSIPDEAFSEVAGVEHFQRIAPPAEPGEQEDDLFAGVEGQAEAA
jgi:LmbE family N-acetylglucosaminyl deacetylase